MTALVMLDSSLSRRRVARNVAPCSQFGAMPPVSTNSRAKDRVKRRVLFRNMAGTPCTRYRAALARHAFGSGLGGCKTQRVFPGP